MVSSEPEQAMYGLRQAMPLECLMMIRSGIGIQFVVDSAKQQ